MKELEVKLNKLTNLPQTPYSKGGDIFMAEPGRGEKPMGVDEATRRLEIAAKVGEQTREQASARRFLEEHKEELPVEIRKGLEEIAGESEVRNASTGSNETPPTPKTGRAIWRSNNADQPVIVTGSAGKGADGRDYVNVEGSATAIPLDEIEFPQEPSTQEAGGAGVPPGGEPPAPPVFPPEEPNNGEAEDIGSGITDPKLLNEINAIKSSIAAGLPPEQILAAALGRVALFETGYGTAEEQEQRSQQKQILIQRIQNAVRNVINENVRERSATRREGLYGERKLLDSEIKLIKEAKKPEDLDELFNRMFDTVDSLPQVDFDTGFGSIGQFEYAEFLKVLNEEISEQNSRRDFVRAKELGDIRTQFSKEKSARTIIHNAYFAVISAQNTEAVSNYMASFLTGYADLAFRKSGVVQAMHFYEQALLMVREKNGGYLPAKEVVGNLRENVPGEVNILTEELLTKANNEGRLVVDEQGKPILDEQGKTKQLAKWEIDRALSFARGMSVVTGRSIEIAATSILPGVESGSSVYIDLFAQKIIAEIYPFRHADKFITRGKVSRALAYILDRPRKPWTPKELEEFAAMGLEEQVKVLNDLMPEGKERFYSVLNPFEIGSWLSRSGWRIGGDPRNPGETAIKEMMMKPEERGWIGTGVIIEKERGNLEKLDSKVTARQREGAISLGKIENALERTARVTPLRFFLNIREFKERVLKDLLEIDSVSSSIEGKKRDDYYFSNDEKKVINDEINRRVEEKEKTRDEEDTKDAELLERKGLKPAEKDEKKEEERKEEQRDRITFEEVMKHPGFSKDMKDLILLQERAVMEKNKALVLENSPLGRILSSTFLDREAGVIKGSEETFQQMFLRRLKDKSWKTPFIFGTEDVPFNKYVFEATGARSGSRRWADMAAAAKAGQAFGELLNGLEAFTEQGQIVEAMYKIHHSIKDYNEESAQRFILSLSEGIMKFYAKTWAHRLPLGIGTANSMIGGNSSYAQIAFGRDKMAWDETKLNEFTRLVRNRGMNTVEQQHKLQERAGGDKKGVVWDSARTMLPLIMIALAYYVMSQAAKKES